MADSLSSSQSHLSGPAPSRPSRAARGKSSLVHTNVHFLHDLIYEFGESFPNLMHLQAYNHPSKYNQKKVNAIAELFGIVTPYRAVAPGFEDRACFSKPGAIWVNKEIFYAGFRLPPPSFVFRLLAEDRVCPTKLQPNTWSFIYYFLVQYGKHNIEPSISGFRYLFKISNSPNNTGWVKIIHMSLSRSCFINGISPDSLRNWKKEWFYVFLDGADWDEFFRPSFSRSVDGLIRDIKMGIDETTAVATLTGDCLNH